LKILKVEFFTLKVRTFTQYLYRTSGRYVNVKRDGGKKGEKEMKEEEERERRKGR
jgi:hypothetical protein